MAASSSDLTRKSVQVKIDVRDLSGDPRIHYKLSEIREAALGEMSKLGFVGAKAHLRAWFDGATNIGEVNFRFSFLCPRDMSGTAICREIAKRTFKKKARSVRMQML